MTDNGVCTEDSMNCWSRRQFLEAGLLGAASLPATAQTKDRTTRPLRVGSLRLRFDLGLRQDQIARSCLIGQATVHRYLERAAAAGLSWPLPEDCHDRRLEELLFPAPVGRPSPQTRLPLDFAEIRRQLQSHKHVILQLLWEEYRQRDAQGYSYSRFCELYQQWSRCQDVVLRQEHRAGEKVFVDWAGDTIPLYDRHNGQITPASLFVAVLGAST